MALDEAILNAAIEKKIPNTLRFFKWEPSAVSIGRNQSLSNEVDLNAVRENGFNVIRRITGGGAVFHDSIREITYSIVCPLKFLEKLNAKNVIEQFEIIEAGIVNALTYYGLQPQKGVIHCPAIFLIRKKGYLLQHGTILLELDPNLMYSVLKAPYNVGKTKMVKSVFAKCIGIKEQLDHYDETKFLSYLKAGFEATLGFKLIEGNFTEYELNLADKLVSEKYSNKNWLEKYE